MTTLAQIEEWEKEQQGWGSAQPSNLMPPSISEQPDPISEQIQPASEPIKQETSSERIARWGRGESLPLIDKAIQEGDTRKAEIISGWDKAAKEAVGEKEETPFKFTTTEPLRSVTPRGYEEKPEELPESRFGVLGDIGSGLASGVVQLTEMAHRTARAFDAPGDIDIVRNFTTNQIAYLDNLQKEYPRIFKPSKQTQRNVVRNAIYGGFSAIVPSIGAGALGVALAPASPIAAFALGAGGVFAASEFDTYMEDAQKKGKTYNESLPYAIASGAVEGGGEAIADLVGAKLLGLNKAALLPFKNSVKGMLHKNIGRFFGTLVKPMPVEVGTEIGQEAGETWIRNLQGISDEDPLKQGMQAVGPAIVMTLLFGAGGAYHNKSQRKALQEVLVNKDINPAQRMKAVETISKSIKKKDVDLAENWEATAKMYVDNKMAIPIDAEISDFVASKGETKGRITQRGKKPTEDIDKTIETLKKDYQASAITDTDLEATKAVASPELLKRWDEITVKPEVKAKKKPIKAEKKDVPQIKKQIGSLEDRIGKSLEELKIASKEIESITDDKAHTEKAAEIAHLESLIEGRQGKLEELQKEAGIEVKAFVPKKKPDAKIPPIAPEIKPKPKEAPILTPEEKAAVAPAEEALEVEKEAITAKKEIPVAPKIESEAKEPIAEKAKEPYELGKKEWQEQEGIEPPSEYVYHGTPVKNLENIKRAGLESQTRERNDWEEGDKTPQEQELLYFEKGENKNWGGKDSVQLRIDADKLPEGVDIAEDELRKGEFYTYSYGNESYEIPPDAIEYYDKKLKKWIPLFDEHREFTKQAIKAGKIKSHPEYPELTAKTEPTPTPVLEKEKAPVTPEKGVEVVEIAKYKAQAKDLGIKYDGITKGMDRSFPGFTDPKTGGSFSVIEGETVEGKLKAMRETFRKAEEAKAEDKKADSESLQLVQDNIATIKSQGKSVPEHLIKRLADLRGVKVSESEMVGNEVFGHPLATNIMPDKYGNLIPIKVKTIEAVERFIGKAQREVDALQSRVVKRKGTKPLNMEEEAILDMLRTETMPELNRLAKALEPPAPKAEAKPIRFEAGKKLTKENRKEVLASINDVYEGIEKVSKGLDNRGEEIWGYDHRPDLFVKSDITGKMLRHYVTLPDGRVAHPTELFPSITQAQVDRALIEQKEKVEQEEYQKESKRNRIVKYGTQHKKNEANRLYSQTGRPKENSFFMENEKGDFVRAEKGEDSAFYETLGFKPTTKTVKELEAEAEAEEKPEVAKPKYTDTQLKGVTVKVRAINPKTLKIVKSDTPVDASIALKEAEKDVEAYEALKKCLEGP